MSGIQHIEDTEKDGNSIKGRSYGEVKYVINKCTIALTTNNFMQSVPFEKRDFHQIVIVKDFQLILPGVDLFEPSVEHGFYSMVCGILNQ